MFSIIVKERIPSCWIDVTQVEGKLRAFCRWWDVWACRCLLLPRRRACLCACRCLQGVRGERIMSSCQPLRAECAIGHSIELLSTFALFLFALWWEAQPQCQLSVCCGGERGCGTTLWSRLGEGGGWKTGRGADEDDVDLNRTRTVIVREKNSYTFTPTPMTRKRRQVSGGMKKKMMRKIACNCSYFISDFFFLSFSTGWGSEMSWATLRERVRERRRRRRFDLQRCDCAQVSVDDIIKRFLNWYSDTDVD